MFSVTQPFNGNGKDRNEDDAKHDEREVFFDDREISEYIAANKKQPHPDDLGELDGALLGGSEVMRRPSQGT